MDNVKDDEYYIEKCIENIDAILAYAKNKSFDEFINDEMLIDAVMFRLVQMAENISHISIEYKNKHSKIKWGHIVGFRNGIVHDYGKTDYSIVYEIISKDLSELKEEMQDTN